MNRRLRFGFSAVCASKVPLQTKVPASSRHIQFVANFDFEVIFDISTVRATEVSDAIESNFHFGFDRGCFSAAHTIALRKMVVKASFSKSQGPCPMKIYTLRAAMRSLVQMTG